MDISLKKSNAINRYLGALEKQQPTSQDQEKKPLDCKITLSLKARIDQLNNSSSELKEKPLEQKALHSRSIQESTTERPIEDDRLSNGSSTHSEEEGPSSDTSSNSSNPVPSAEHTEIEENTELNQIINQKALKPNTVPSVANNTRTCVII